MITSGIGGGYRRSLMMAAASGQARQPMFITGIRGDGQSYIDTGISLGSLPFEITTTCGSIGAFRQENVCLSTFRSNSAGWNLFFTGTGSNRRMDLFIGAHNYLSAGGWYNDYEVKIEYDGNGTYTWTVGENTATISSTVTGGYSLKLFARGDLGSSTISDTILGVTTIKYGANLENIMTFKPIFHNGLFGMWDVENSVFRGRDGSAGYFFGINKI